MIWESEGMNPTAAFMEFTKLMFVKLYCDRELRTNEKIKSLLSNSGDVKVPKASVVFSVHWIDQREKEKAENPVNDLLFESLRKNIEKDIALRQKKRIFARDERIRLNPETIKTVVERLQHYDMFGIDEDLNGRLFETFLNATMRGRELGQYFTPRSIVKLMTKMAGLSVTRKHVDKVLDACCGTGGFLIEVLTEMRNIVRKNTSLSKNEHAEFEETICNQSIYGIDFGKDPPIARIARINMYLHGDGGSRIYDTDSLDKELMTPKGTQPEEQTDLKELRDEIDQGLRFDAVLTNPPFSMTKKVKKKTDARILAKYELALVPGTNKIKKTLRSNVMFIERYCDLLAPGGRLLTVMDETLMAGDDYARVRKFIRDNFLIRAIVSLPGDAFKRSGARVKTSILCLDKKRRADDRQSSVYVAFSEFLGVDDLTHRAWADEVTAARQKAEEEMNRIASEFHRFLEGDTTVKTVRAERVAERLDLKFVVPMQGRFARKWEAAGAEVKQVRELAELREETIYPRRDTPDEDYTWIKVTYDGICTAVKRCKGRQIKYDRMQRVYAGDLVLSEIRATDGAIGLVPKEMDRAVVSENFIVLHGLTPTDAVYLWSILRTYELRADLMSPSTGTGRYRTEAALVLDLQVPWQDLEKRKKIASDLTRAWGLERKIKQLCKDAAETISELGVESEDSKRRFASYKPPK